MCYTVSVSFRQLHAATTLFAWFNNPVDSEQEMCKAFSTSGCMVAAQHTFWAATINLQACCGKSSLPSHQLPLCTFLQQHQQLAQAGSLPAEMLCAECPDSWSFQSLHVPSLYQTSSTCRAWTMNQTLVSFSLHSVLLSSSYFICNAWKVFQWSLACAGMKINFRTDNVSLNTWRGAVTLKRHLAVTVLYMTMR